MADEKAKDQEKQQKLSSSTIVDLKNELYRKRTEFDYRKVSGSSCQVTQKKLHEILKHGAEEVHSKPPTSKITVVEEPVEPESEVLAKSRAALERKAALYEKLARGEEDSSNFQNEDDDEEGYLVDFDRKLVHEQRRSPSPVHASLNKSASDEEEWADYVDNRGVKRRCLKSDLEELRSQQKRIRTEDQLAALSHRTDLLSRDDMRELERQRWEAKARGELRTSDDEQVAESSGTGFFESREPVRPLHYSHLASDETHVHGVGFFSFSGNEDERMAQMEALNKLHEQTADQRRRSADVQKRREDLKRSRLAKVLERRGQQLSETISETEPAVQEVIMEAEKPPPDAPSTSTDKLALPGSDLTWPKMHQQRPWDKGKSVPSAPAWQRSMEERRKERNEGFAPPSAYYRK